ncbi:ImmA/IrrE family metallo-endopeptidase [Paenibacillus caseinilyticus]|uniref:ImmA/IrrE family metallo-endopeptidase n=1 Tax=Paenibacillus caseinilyticus TaxID=3098138 RepID=UPI0022B90A71|nr:ImmA/IrrE family metallo-endopeptidase [Paenibacillus caseinilyticus]MCZ8518858.1 ImmA/IrrE family metallo-endopeptidase [Paenibacillus caseinilyticus]
MRTAKGAALHLMKKYGTNDPYEIASHKNISVIFEHLGSILGFFSTYKRINFIHINSNSNEAEQRFTCAHELGHFILHPKVNTPFLRKNTLLSIDRIEREANEFAVELLIPDELIASGTSIYTAAATCGVPHELAHLKRIANRVAIWDSFS